MNIKKILAGVSSVLVSLSSLFVIFTVPAFADTVSVDFENPPYSLGVINAQDGWVALGSAGSGCAVYDQAVNSSLGTTGFGSQSFRISDAVTSGCFGDQAFAKPLVDAVGESSATAGTFSVGSLQNHFEMQFDIASTIPGSQQTGLHVSVSPDRGDGSRMSYLRFEDNSGGIEVHFSEVTGATSPVNFSDDLIATLNRSIPHNVKLTLDTIEGPSNDVVKVWIDGTLVKTGTSWENYYRYDAEASSEQSVRIVKTVIFRSAGTAVPADAGNGFLFDNLSLFSSVVKTLVGKATGGLTLGNPRQQISFNAFDYGPSGLDEGNVEYQNFTYPGGLHYTASLLCANVKSVSHEAWFMFQIPTGFPGLSGLYVISYVKDLATPGTKGDIYAHTATGILTEALSMCETGTIGTNYPVTGGNTVVHK